MFLIVSTSTGVEDVSDPESEMLVEPELPLSAGYIY
jgi:hypothetical protein